MSKDNIGKVTERYSRAFISQREIANNLIITPTPPPSTREKVVEWLGEWVGEWVVNPFTVTLCLGLVLEFLTPS